MSQESVESVGGSAYDNIRVANIIISTPLTTAAQ